MTPTAIMINLNQDLSRWLQKEKTVALGEIDLDIIMIIHRRGLKRELFIRQLKWAAEIENLYDPFKRTSRYYDILEKHMIKIVRSHASLFSSTK